MTQTHRDELRAFLAEKLHIPPAELNDGDLLFSTGRIDSLGAIDLIVFLEQRFGVDTGDPDFDPSMLDSVDEILQIVPQ